MKRILFLSVFLSCLGQLIAQPVTQKPATRNMVLLSHSLIQLPEPHKTGGMPLMEALNKRRTARSFETRELSIHQLSNLLWAAFGINRSDGKRTAPSAMNRQETDLYVLLKKGAYLYDPEKLQLLQVNHEDIRSYGGTQSFVKNAPVTVILVANLSKMSDASLEKKTNTANIDAGYISQNIYLFCASEGLVTGARGSVDRQKLAFLLKLKKDQLIIIAQSIGYPGSNIQGN